MSPDSSEVSVQTPIETTGDAIVAAMVAGGVDHLFFTSGSEIGFYQEAVAKARVLRSEERRVGKECRSRWSPYH